MLYSRYIDTFIGVSNYTKKHILKDYGFFLSKKTIVVYNGIDTTVFEKRIQDNFGKFIVTSHLRKSKGIQDLIEAIALLPADLQNLLQIDIYGDGPMGKELKQMVLDQNLGHIFRFQGSSADLNRIFCNYSFMIQPTYMECFSLSILESLSANVPVITTTVGGNLEVVVDAKNGYIFEPKDVAKLSLIIQKILKNESSISNDTNVLIEKRYNLELMVENHYKTIENNL